MTEGDPRGPLLGRRGSVEVTAAGGLRLRDSVASLGRILPLLSHWDHPPSLLVGRFHDPSA